MFSQAKAVTNQRHLLPIDPGPNDSNRSHSNSEKLKQSKNNNNNPEPTVYIVDPIERITYLRGRLLGKGGFARCYELTDLVSNKMYAGKIIPKSRITKPHQKEKIAREIDLHRNLHHKHVVGFHKFFEDADNVYIILELCSRKSLVHVLKNRKNLTEPEVRYYVRHLIYGCQFIRSQRIVHRDLKLGNMLLNENMELKIADFGLATRLEYQGEKKTTVCGTPNYIAPEVLTKKGHSYEADIWAIGCIIFALLVGRPPFETPTLKETYTRISNNKYTFPPNLSTSARNIIGRCLKPEPSQRPSLEQLLQDDFFSSGHTPKVLSPTCCTSAPKFPIISTLASDLHFNNRPMSYPQSKSQNNIEAQRNTPTTKPSMPKILGKPPSAPARHSPNLEIENISPTVQGVIRNVVSGAFSAGSTPTSSSCDSDRSESPRPGTAISLHTVLSACLSELPTDTEEFPEPVSGANILWITKWVDYSNKYGFGFQLSNKMVGVLFNDTSRMSLASNEHAVQYCDITEKLSQFTLETVPSNLQKRTQLLLYFAQYMDEHLIKGGDIKVPGDINWSVSSIFMKKWFRTSKAIIMYLSNSTLQINFFDDHTKIILSFSETDAQYIVTYINETRTASSFLLSDIHDFGCPPDIKERLLYAKQMLENIIDIEGDDV